MSDSATSAPSPSVSVVVAARDAASTLSETLASLLAQTFANWEVVVVDDGSTDETATIVDRLGASDGRVRLIRQDGRGTSAARNAGISAARGEWLLFLDADDLLLPEALSSLVRAAEAEPDIAVAYCGFARVDATGKTRINEWPATLSGDVFDEFARRCLFACHCGLVRRSLVVRAGGFDESHTPCEDWDLWQRIARTGARFQAVEDVLAIYRTHPQSRSMALRAQAIDSLRIVETGHGPDPRVPDAALEHVHGARREDLPAARVEIVMWTLALALGKGEVPDWLDEVDDDLNRLLSPRMVIDHLYWTVPIGAGMPVNRWGELWPLRKALIEKTLDELERRSGAPAFAARAKRMLERRIAEWIPRDSPARLGRVTAATVELDAALSDLRVDADVLVCFLNWSGQPIGRVELPVCDGVVTADVLRDAVCDRHSWEILGRFLGTRDSDYDVLRHDREGWLLFLRELWGKPDWSGDDFYAVSSEQPPSGGGSVARIEVEIGEEVQDVGVQDDVLAVEVKLAGRLLGIVTTRGNRTVGARELIASITGSVGFELCRAAVCEAVVGWGPDGRRSLRERLSARAPSRERVSGPGALVLVRRSPTIFGTSSSRRSALPRSCARELAEAASACGEGVLDAPGSSYERVEYRPDVLLGELSAVDEEADAGAATTTATLPVYGRSHFESLFASHRHPWDYDCAYEQTKYRQTLDLIPAGVRQALEIGCAEGHFTAQLSSRVESLVAADISQVALERAAMRCAGIKNVSFLRLDVTKDSLPEPFDLIVCSELLYYLRDAEELEAVARRLAAALAPGGCLVTANAHVVADDPDSPGFDWGLPFGGRVIGEALRRGPLRLVREVRTPLYRVQLFRRSSPGFARRRPSIVELDQPTALPESLAVHVSWSGGSRRPPYVREEEQTDSLPILMYHRIGDPVEGPLAPYTVGPDAFEEQLAYLRDAGYRSASLGEWLQRVTSGRPLPGRAVLLTFDDGYRDFAETAWPLLRRYGFGAVVFLVADRVGTANEWDRGLGLDLPLLDWPRILRLQEEGVVFGAHSATHPPLTGLGNDETVREAVRARTVLATKLGRPVQEFAYPYGDVDPAVAHLVGGCGFTFGLTTEPRRCTTADSLLELPRLEVDGTTDFAEFVRRLEA